MVVKQGEIYWVDWGDPVGSEPACRHPHLVLQGDLFNQSRINTVVVCALTSNLKRGRSPGNVTLNRGEANLSKKSVVNVTQIYTVNREELVDRIGAVSAQRMAEVVAGAGRLMERIGE